MKFIVYTCAWLFLTTGIILSSIAMGHFAIYGHFSSEPIMLSLGGGEVKITSAAPTPVPPAQQELSTETAAGDARIILVNNFLERYKSPILEEDPEFAKFLVELADKYQVDFRLLPAIAMQESNLCKVTPPESHNCLGLGVHARGTWEFPTYRENFEAAAKILKSKYIDIGLTTPEQIMRKYTPGSNGSWAASVNQWMAEMRYDDRSLGRELKTDANLLEFTESTPSASPSLN